MRYDIVALGELLVDITMTESTAAPPQMQGDAGGAPANVLAAATRLNGRTAFIGMVGDDRFGDFLTATLDAYQIDATGVMRTSEDRTTLAFVRIDAAGERDFTFARNPGADTLLRPEDVCYELIAQSRFFHFGALSLTHSPAREATWAAVDYAQCHGVTVSFDPNWRASLWPNEESARVQMRLGVEKANLVKVSEEELFLLTGCTDIEKGLAELAAPEKLVVATLGAKGCAYQLGNRTGAVPGVAVEAVDTTGAGDAFLGALLMTLRTFKESLERLSTEELEEALLLANRVGAWTAGHRGTMAAFPTAADLKETLS
ncbi:fructokinase [Alicyclobacillus acidoterrestris]|uniref:carbohydrate kinase family protein n=1 Tax=Alicyclobacillus suci TaxID=2816080 RepID=UPI00119611FC|nr:carbohydrate kinase [Alicyclobacillus suci]GEO27233.1 fructokinase [Alicyclobacillus acidoterrestris]